jgi:hypothetical protein
LAVEYDSLARRIFDLAGVAPDDAPDMGALASALLGDPCLAYASAWNTPWHVERRPCGGWTVRIRRSLSREKKAYAVACGLVTWAARIGEAPPLKRRGVQDLATHILLPRPVLQRCVDEDLSVDEIAEAHVCPLAVVRLRMREDFPPLLNNVVDLATARATREAGRCLMTHDTTQPPVNESITAPENPVPAFASTKESLGWADSLAGVSAKALAKATLDLDALIGDVEDYDSSIVSLSDLRRIGRSIRKARHSLRLVRDHLDVARTGETPTEAETPTQ